MPLMPPEPEPALVSDGRDTEGDDLAFELDAGLGFGLVLVAVATAPRSSSEAKNSSRPSLK